MTIWGSVLTEATISRTMRGTTSEPFATLRSSETSLRSTSQAGENERIAVKALDLRGKEVARVVNLGSVKYTQALQG